MRIRTVVDKWGVDRDYQTFLDGIQGERILLYELDNLLKGNYHLGKYLCIRHDTDHSLQKALDMAKWEADNDILATYFVLLDTPDYKPKLVYEIADLGHEIGYHNNAYYESLRQEIPVEKILGEQLARLRDDSCVLVVGTAAHGDPQVTAQGILNYNVWKHRGGNIRLEDFGLQYEAYSLRRDVYLTDSGAKFRGYLEPMMALFEVSEWGRSEREAVDYFNDLEVEEKKGAVMQLLIHPIWWEMTE